MQRTFVLILALILSLKLAGQDGKENGFFSSASKKNEIILLGLFHFNNPGADVVKTKSFDIQSAKSQNALKRIRERIDAFRPTQVFVEWEYSEQQELDSLYAMYLNNEYFQKTKQTDFYLKNEIFQLGFPIAKSNKIAQIKAIDYAQTEFPFDSLMRVIKKSKQVHLEKRIEAFINEMTDEFNSQLFQNWSLEEILLNMNTKVMRQKSNEFHNQIPLLAGEIENFIGVYLTSEWYRRNLYMWSLIQKGSNKKNEKVLVLVGASHAAMISTFITRNLEWKEIPIEVILYR